MPTGYDASVVKSDDEFVRQYVGYEANSLGQIRSIYTGEICLLETINGIPSIKTNALFTQFARVKEKGCLPAAEVILCNFKPNNLPLQYVFLCSALPKDGNEFNLHPSNLVWKFPKEGLPVEHVEGFFYIPGYTQYAINRQGVVLHVKSGQIKEPRLQAGRSILTLYKDGYRSNHSVYIYRLLALTFLDYPLYVEDLVVNHKDGYLANDDIDNLEWITQAENMRHAVIRRVLGSTPPRYTYVASEYDANLTAVLLSLTDKESSNLSALMSFMKISQDAKLASISKSPDVAIKGGGIQRLNILTNEIKLFHSRKQAMEESGIIDNQLYQSLKASSKEGEPGIVKSLYIFRYVGESFPEITAELLNNHLKYGGHPRVTLLKNAETGEITEYESAAALCRETGLAKKLVTYRLGAGKQVILNTCFRVQYKDSLTDWQ